MSHFSLVRAVLLRSYERLQTELAHQVLHSLVIDLRSELANGSRHASVAIAPFVTGKERTDLRYQGLVLIARLSRFLLIVEGTTRQTSQFQQAGEREVSPQFNDYLRFLRVVVRCCCCA